MTHPFDPLAGWPAPLPAHVERLDFGAVIEAAHRHVERDLAVALRFWPIRDWLSTSPIAHMLRELLSCILAVDCWRARLVCPQKEFSGRAWGRYFETRRDVARPFLSAALARSAVLERIPVRWIPEQQVIAKLNAQARKCGVETEITALHIVPPVTGGSEWVRRDCDIDGEALMALVQTAPVAAVLHWPNRTEAAVVTFAQGQMKAFGTAFRPDGLAFRVSDLVGCDVVPPTRPPETFWQHGARMVGLGACLWKAVCGHRLKKGVNPLAAI